MSHAPALLDEVPSPPKDDQRGGKISNGTRRSQANGNGSQPPARPHAVGPLSRRALLLSRPRLVRGEQGKIEPSPEDAPGLPVFSSLGGVTNQGMKRREPRVRPAGSPAPEDPVRGAAGGAIPPTQPDPAAEIPGSAPEGGVTGGRGADRRVVVVGAGPAGLFAALELVYAGLKPVIVERGM